MWCRAAHSINHQNCLHEIWVQKFVANDIRILHISNRQSCAKSLMFTIGRRYLIFSSSSSFNPLHCRGGQQVDRRVSAGRSRLILIWIVTRLKRTFSINFPFYCILWHFLLVTWLPTGRSRVLRKFSGRSQSRTSWPPLPYSNTPAVEHLIWKLNRLGHSEDWQIESYFLISIG